MAEPVTLIAKLKNGDYINITAPLGWDKFIGDFHMCKGIGGYCLWIPADAIASITPPASNNVALVAGNETKQ